MKIVKAEIGNADIIGKIHSMAWRQAYADMFPEEYLCADSPGKRTQEFLESCNNEDVHYFLLYSDEMAVGIVKVNLCGAEICEISSFYILDEYRNKGYGKQVVSYLKNVFDKTKIQLWVLEKNKRARRFYENNGFKNTGRTRSINRGNYYTQLLYELINTKRANVEFYIFRVNFEFYLIKTVVSPGSSHKPLACLSVLRSLRLSK